MQALGFISDEKDLQKAEQLINSLTKD